MASNPTFDPQAGTTPIGDSVTPVTNEAGKLDILSSLRGYKAEARQAREGGENPRDSKYQENLDLYWNRYDFSHKEKWQARETMPEVPGFVDRFAASLKEALMATNGDFYTIQDPTDTENDLGGALKNLNDMWLSQSGANQNGTILGFPAVFEEQMKLGALMATSAVVTWKDDVKDGRVSIDAVDPRKVWLDPTGRNLYRLRQIDIDKHELLDMAKAKDSKGGELFNLDEVQKLVTSIQLEDLQRRESLTGAGEQLTSPRSPIVLDEYIATLTSADGAKSHDKALFVVANDKYLLRGPEKNPFWHKKDWLTFAPLVTVPLSVYGRSYMEDFGSVARTFTNLTNMLLDATYTSAMKAWAIVPGMLINPGQVAEGLSPMKLFQIEDGYDPKDFAKELELGTLSPDALKMWALMKQQLSEAAQMNEIGMGQFAPRGRTSATEVMSTQQNSSATIRSVANTIETRFLNPVLDLTWKTGLQHMKKTDTMLQNAVGPDMYTALWQRRKELAERPLTFQAQGLSAMIQRAQTLKALLSVFQIIGSNQVLAQLFMQKVDMSKFLELIFRLDNLDMSKLMPSARDQMIRQVTEPLQGGTAAQGSSPASPAANQAMGGIASTLGIGGGQ